MDENQNRTGTNELLTVIFYISALSTSVCLVLLCGAMATAPSMLGGFML